MASPAWHAAAALDTWVTLPNSNLSLSGVMQSGGSAVVNKWGGAVLALDGLYIGGAYTPGTFLVPFGGGHTDYGGNEVYAYGPLEDDAPTWYRLRDQTIPFPQDVDEDASGNPVSRHTYQALSYVNAGGRNWMVCMGILYSYSASNGYTTVHRYNFDQVSPNANQPWAKLAAADGAADISCVDATLGCIWYHSNATNHVGFYDITTDTHTSQLYKSPVGYGGNACSCIDPVRGLWCIWDGSQGLSFYRTNNGAGNDYYVPTTTGTAPTGQGSILYDPVDDVLRLWVGGGKTLWTLTPPATNPYQGGNAWVWSQATAATGDVPDAQNDNGTFGRFAYSPHADIVGYVLLNNPDGNIYFYKSGDSVAGGVTHNLSISAAVGVSAGLARQATHPRAVQAAISPSASLPRALASSRRIASGVSLAAALSPTATRPRAIPTTAPLAAAFTRQTRRFHVLAAVVAPAAAFRLSRGLGRTLATTLSPAAMLAHFSLHPLAISLQVGLAAGLARALTAARTVAAAVTPAALISRLTTHRHSIATAAPILSTTAHQAGRTRTIAAALPVAAAFSLSRAIGRTVAATAPLAASFSRLATRPRTVRVQVSPRAALSRALSAARAIAAVVPLQVLQARRTTRSQGITTTVAPVAGAASQMVIGRRLATTVQPAAALTPGAIHAQSIRATAPVQAALARQATLSRRIASRVGASATFLLGRTLTRRIAAALATAATVIPLPGVLTLIRIIRGDSAFHSEFRGDSSFHPEFRGDSPFDPET